jgi:ubiquinone/menaquinone biosynthesis C-methylase UbiE
MVTADLDSLEIRPGQRVLDAGCGSGRHIAGLHRFSGIGIVGVDLDVSDLEQARHRLELHDRLDEQAVSYWSLLAGDIQALPFPNDAFDLVICSEVMEHIPDHSRAARELVRVLKPGASLVVSVPRTVPEAICWRLSKTYGTEPGGHIRIYRAADVISLVEQAGTRHNRTHYAHGLHSPYWWMKCLVGLNRETALPVRLYHRFLTWDLMKKPRLTRWLEGILDPFIGKSMVFYFTKNPRRLHGSKCRPPKGLEDQAPNRPRSRCHGSY